MELFLLLKGGICAVNEIGRMNSEGQGHFLGVMQEGFFTLNKHGINVKVKAPTAIIASANPPAGNFQDPQRVDIDEIPMILLCSIGVTILLCIE